jgi:nicotinamide-nucleotide amidase
MPVEIITIGEELLIGQVVDTNSAWLGQELNKAGFIVQGITTVSDKREAIKEAVTASMARADIVLVTGGLGPTNDDITKTTLCELWDAKLVFSQAMYENVCRVLKGRVRSINALNRQQAMVPNKCIPILNPVGTAPVMWFDKEEKVLVSMPGVPHEMKTAMRHEIMPRLQERFQTGIIIHRTVLVFNYPEAVLADHLSDWEAGLPGMIQLAYLPSPGRIRLRLTARGDDREDLDAALNTAVDQLNALIGEHIYGYADESPAQILGRLLKERGHSVATAESCTGGLIGHLLTSIPGSSSYFKGSIVAYHNDVKVRQLKVGKKALVLHGAVSQQVVEQMAQGAREQLQVDYALATSGIAGPDGGSEEKPVGTVWIALATPEGTWSMKFHFGKVRERNIQRSAEYSLVLLVKYLQTGRFYKKPEF